jgi:hypothetical protein
MIRKFSSTGQNDYGEKTFTYETETTINSIIVGSEAIQIDTENPKHSKHFCTFWVEVCNNEKLELIINEIAVCLNKIKDLK